MAVIKKNEDQKKENVQSDNKEEIVSAYSQRGKIRNKENNSNIFTKGFTIIYVIVAILGLLLALGVIYLIERFQ